jgi:hypothetical protein
MRSRVPLLCAVSPATARPRVKASCHSKPSRSATTAAQSVKTGARFDGDGSLHGRDLDAFLAAGRP